ncbi:hypothetical protein FRB96_005599 [Tulasnella sp. 330]|nr:hypothetical protein FRB96_005599 [Tulasnella sp. 330]KAG8886357.1 hypothetical protein FRB97_004892 [Tulasnella sp. 331]
MVMLTLGVTALPFNKRQSSAITDVDILQYALTLEHLENTFYSGTLTKFDASAFTSAGFDPLVRERFVEIAAHEQEHVTFLTAALGSQATQACTYNFPYTDVKSFTAVSMILEGVGTSAYLGAAASISDKTLLTSAGSILTTEARQAGWVSSSVLGHSPWSGPFETPLDFNQVFTLASAMIASCPSSNPTLPFKAFPSLTISSSTPATPGANVALEFTGSTNASGLFLSIFTGLDVISVAITANGEVTLPSNLTGTSYAVVSKTSSDVTDAATVAGPVVFQFY